MYNNVFALQLITSFIVGGLAIALQTLIAERVTGFWRSLVITVPLMLAMGLFFVGLTKSPQDVADVVRVVPAALGPDYLFVTVFAILASRGIILSLVGGLIAWSLSAYYILQFPPLSFTTSTLLYGLPTIILCYLITSQLRQESYLKPFPINGKTILLRSLVGGIIIALVVFFAKKFGNVWGGLLSAFPATFSSTLIIYYFLQGKHVIPSVAKAFFFPGFFGFIVYAFVAGLTFPAFGIWLGTLFSYGAYVIFSSFYFYCSAHAKR